MGRSILDLASAPMVQASPAKPAKEPFQSNSFIEKYKHLLEEEAEARGSFDGRSTLALGHEFAPRTPVPSATSEEPEDQALETYMSSLMRRVTGDVASAASRPLPTAHVERHAAVSDPSVGAPRESAPFEPIDLETLRNSTRKVALSSDIGALRELANSSARGAIAKHHKKRRIESVASQLFVCVTTMSAAAYLMGTAETLTSAAFGGGCLILLLGGYIGIQVVVMLLSAVRDSGLSQSNTEELASKFALPIEGVAEKKGN